MGKELHYHLHKTQKWLSLLETSSWSLSLKAGLKAPPWCVLIRGASSHSLHGLALGFFHSAPGATPQVAPGALSLGKITKALSTLTT